MLYVICYMLYVICYMLYVICSLYNTAILFRCLLITKGILNKIVIYTQARGIHHMVPIKTKLEPFPIILPWFIYTILLSMAIVYVMSATCNYE